MRARNGFTLLETLLVIALVALITTIAIPSFTKVFRVSTEGFARQTATLLKDARDRSLLLGRLIRLRIDLDKQEFWLEEAPGNYLLPSQKEIEKKKREARAGEEEKDESFRLLKELTKEKRKLPDNLQILRVITPRHKKPVEEGTVDIYFFANGTADSVILHLEDDEKSQQSILVHPITGMTKLRPGLLAEDKE